jgi:hypothetical protein
MKDKLSKLVVVFLQESLNILSNSNSNVSAYVEFEVLQKRNGFYMDSKKTDKYNFKTVVNNNWKKIVLTPEYNVCKNFLKTLIKKQYRIKNIQYDEDDLKFQSEKELREFLIYYLYNNQNLKFKKSTLNQIFDEFFNYLDNEYGTTFCFATLLNLDGTFDEMKLDNDSYIRKITPNEYSVVGDIKGKLEKPQVHPALHKIKYILITKVDPRKVKQKYLESIFSRPIDAFRLFQKGDVKLGGFYFSESEKYSIKPIMNLRPEPKIPFSSSYKLSSNKVKQFIQFQNIFFKNNLTRGKFSFLNTAITRFSKSLDDVHVEDILLDNVISLESMYSANESELSFKFSIRVASLLGRNPNEMKKLQKFMYEIYDLRSRIIHGDHVPDIVGDEDYNMKKEDAIDFLDEITRNSIKIFLTMINDFDSDALIQKEIQNSLYDSQIRKNLATLKKNSPFCDFSFLRSL